MSKLLALVGPTGVGKSELALTIARQFDGEIVSADSMQIYRDLTIGTAAVPVEQRQGISHHLMNSQDWQTPYSVADFKEQATRVIQAIQERGKLPIIVGGTGFYLQALLGDRQLTNSTEKVADDISAMSLDALLNELELTDPQSFSTIDQQNRRRVERAVAISRSGQQYSQTPTGQRQYEALLIGLEMPREQLYQKINQRSEQMVQHGLLDEAQAVLDAGGEQLQVGSAIGYKEFFDYLAGQTDLPTSLALLQRDSRRYAKRQLTFFKRQFDDIHWFDVTKGDNQEEISALIAQFIE